MPKKFLDKFLRIKSNPGCDLKFYNMKKKIFYSAITFLFAISAITANASSDIKAIKEKIAGMTEAQKEERIQQIKQRVEEIKAMDKSQLSKIERKDLRDELRNMNKEVKAERRGNGIYISLGALIIIILLLSLFCKRSI